MASNVGRTSRSKKPPVRKKHTSPSVVSIFSTVTHNSNGSNESNATVTPQRIERARRRSSASKSGTPKTTSSKSTTKKSSTKASPSSSPVGERPRVNVFAFMEQDEDDATGSSHAAELDGVGMRHELGLETTSGPIHTTIEEENAERAAMQYQAFRESHEGWNNIPPSIGVHSDSGISVRSSSPERESPVLHYQSIKRRPSQPITAFSRGASSAASVHPHMDSSRVLEPYDEIPDMSPEAFYSIASRPTVQHTEYEDASDHLPSHRSVDLGCTVEDEEAELEAEHKTSGFDLLASNISADGRAMLKPIYRKFETLNNRVLLYLQTEISDLEAELKHVDDAIVSASNVVEASQSRPGRVIRSPTPLQWRKKELMARIVAKLEKYSRSSISPFPSAKADRFLDHTFSSYSSLAKILDAAPSADIAAYTEWATKHVDSPGSELSFLSHTVDLVTICTNRPQNTEQSDRTALVTGFGVVMTIIAFKLVSEVLPRLVVGVVVGAAMVLCRSEPCSMNIDCLREYGRRAAIYGGVMIVLAFAVG